MVAGEVGDEHGAYEGVYVDAVIVVSVADGRCEGVPAFLDCCEMVVGKFVVVESLVVEVWLHDVGGNAVCGLVVLPCVWIGVELEQYGVGLVGEVYAVVGEAYFFGHIV